MSPLMFVIVVCVLTLLALSGVRYAPRPKNGEVKGWLMVLVVVIAFVALASHFGLIDGWLRTS